MKRNVYKRPSTRGDCIDAARPCPWVGCRYNTMLEVLPSGSIRLRGVIYKSSRSRGIIIDGPVTLPRDANEATVSLEIDAAVDWLDHHRHAETCMLDVTTWGGCTLDEIGEIMGLTRERIRQIEASSMLVFGPRISNVLGWQVGGLYKERRDSWLHRAGQKREAEVVRRRART